MRIVSLAPSNTEIIFELSAEDQLIATTSLCDFPEEAIELPSVGGWTSGIDFDKIERLEPDLVMTSDSLQEDVKAELEAREIEVFHTEPKTVEEVLESFESVGEIVEREEKAEKFVERFKSQLEEFDLKKKRIYCQEWMNPPMISGNWIPGLVKRTNGKYPVEEGERSRKVEVKQLAEFDPEYVFLNVCGAGENISSEDFLQNKRFREISAVKQNRVFVLDDALLNRPGPRLITGIGELQRTIKE